MNALRALGFALVTAAGCDQSFEPIQPSDRGFSIFGYLDPSREVQWVRVMPTREHILASSEGLGVTVTLENLETGRMVQLRDSVFEFPHVPDIESDGVFVHNYWTDEQIVPGARYRLAVDRADGKRAEATVSIPEPYSVTVAIKQVEALNDELRVSDAPHLPFVAMRTDVQYDCDYTIYGHDLPVLEGPGDPYIAQAFKLIPERADCGRGLVERRELWMAVSHDPWPEGQQHSPAGLDPTRLPSNLDSAVGFLGGVLTRMVPYEECTLIVPASGQYCLLSYDGDAMIRGVVKDGCGAILSEAMVMLEELAPDPIGQRRVRPAPVLLAGTYAISALQPGVEHAVSVVPKPPPPGGSVEPVYATFADTLDALATNQEAIYDITLDRLTPC